MNRYLYAGTVPVPYCTFILIYNPSNFFRRVTKIARKNAVINDHFRSPRTEILRGGEEDSWVWKRENGIRYAFDMRRSMFSRGNISEKLRIAKAGETTI